MSVVLDTLREKQASLLEEKTAALSSLKEVETKCADITSSIANIDAGLEEIESAIAQFGATKGDTNGKAANA